MRNNEFFFHKIAIVGFICLALCACGKDEPEDSNKRDLGRIAILHENGYVADYVVIDATYQGVFFNYYDDPVIVQDDKGGTFHAQMYDANDDDDFSLVQSWKFQTEDKLKVGSRLKLTRILYYTNYSDLNSWNLESDESEGEVIVKKITDKRITLKFNDFKFTYYFVHNYDERSREVVVNGEISYER